MAISSKLDKYLKTLDTDIPEAVSKSFEGMALSLVKELKTSAGQKHGSGLLEQSIGVLPTKIVDGVQTISIVWEDYGTYQDAGVKGTKTGTSNGKAFGYGRDFAYTDKMPPTNFSTIGGRSLGQYAEEKNISPFAIAKSIFYHGLKPSKWATSILDNNALINKLMENVGTKFVNELNK